MTSLPQALEPRHRKDTSLLELLSRLPNVSPTRNRVKESHRVLLPLRPYRPLMLVRFKVHFYHMRQVNASIAMPVTPQPPPRKQWYDKLADAILGDEDVTGSPSSRYALICQKCFSHNGLVKESVWQDTRKPISCQLLRAWVDRFVEYVCPKCGHFNPSARSIQQGITSAGPSPISAVNSRGPNGINGLSHSPLNQPIPIPLSQRQPGLSPESAKVRPRRSFKREVDEDASVEGNTVDMDVDNDSS